MAMALLLPLAQPAPGSDGGDWGYDEPPTNNARPVLAKPVPRQDAAGPSSAPKNTGLSKPNNASSKKAGSTALKNAQNAETSDKTDVATLEAPPVLDDSRCWLEIFALCASSATDDDRKEILQLGTISSDQKNHLKAIIAKKLENPESKARYEGIAAQWKLLRPKITAELDTKESYRLLFRALIRHAMPTIVATNKEFSEYLQDLLGPVRIADSGPPPLTEDAVSAYADMTCFLFKKRKPDRSVDGDDNRQVFVAVIKERFTQAPNAAAKAAMTNFDLTWACFRCRFMEVSESEREKLSQLMASQDSKNSAQLKAELLSPSILKLFAIGPWSEKKVTPAS